MMNPDPDTPAIVDHATTERAGRYRRGGVVLATIGAAAVMASFLWRALDAAALDKIVLFVGVAVSLVGFVMTVEGRYLRVIADLKQEMSRSDRG